MVPDRGWYPANRCVNADAGPTPAKVGAVEADSTLDMAMRLRRLLSGRRFDEVSWVDEVGSTNADLLDAARDGADEQVLLADFQSAGRGRRDRSWTAPPGSSLMLSVLVRRGLTVERAGQLTMALGLAAADACQRTCGVRPQIKWPNDLVHADRKLAGILAEAVVEGSTMTAAVLGMGMNTGWDELPTELATTATSLNLLAGHTIDRVELAARVLEYLEHWLGADSGHLRSAYTSNSATVGRRVRVDLPTGRIEGTADSISVEGHLVIAAADGDRAVSVGDVVHLRPV